MSNLEQRLATIERRILQHERMRADPSTGLVVAWRDGVPYIYNQQTTQIPVAITGYNSGTGVYSWVEEIYNSSGMRIMSGYLAGGSGLLSGSNIMVEMNGVVIASGNFPVHTRAWRRCYTGNSADVWEFSYHQSGGGGGGAAGAEVQGFLYNMDVTSTSGGGIGSGYFRWNNNSQNSGVTRVYFSPYTSDRMITSGYWLLAGPTGFLYMQQQNNSAIKQIWKWTALPTIASGTGDAWQLPIIPVVTNSSGLLSGGAFGSGQSVYVLPDNLAFGPLGTGGGAPVTPSDSDDLGITTTCDVYHPFGEASPTLTNVPCVIYDDLYTGRGSSPLNTVAWTHYIDVGTGVTIYDALTRTASLNTLNYTDGDEVRIPTGGASRYVVALVTQHETIAGVIQRCYLMRHSAG